MTDFKIGIMSFQTHATPFNKWALDSIRNEVIQIQAHWMPLLSFYFLFAAFSDRQFMQIEHYPKTCYIILYCEIM